MEKTMIVRLLSLAIAVSFLTTALSGIGGLASEKGQQSLGEVNTTHISPVKNLDRSKIRQVDLGSSVESTPGDDVKSAPPGNQIDSQVFYDGFEAYTPLQPPTDPPWTTYMAAGSARTWGPDDFENDVVGGNPDSPPWTTMDGASAIYWWGKDFEDTTVGQDLQGAYWSGDNGYFGSFDPACTLDAQNPPAGTVPGSVWGPHTTQTMCARFIDGGAGSYFGPAGITSPDEDHAFAGGWVYMAADTRFDLLLYDLNAGATCVEVAFWAGSGQLAHWPGGTGQLITGPTWAVNEWHELMVEYDDAAQTYSVWWDGTEYVAGSAYTAAGNVNNMIWMGDGTTSCYLDNNVVGIPPSGTAETIDIINTWSCSADGGNQSVSLDQASTANQAYTEVTFPQSGWGENATLSFYMMTPANANNARGATFYAVDTAGNHIMGVRVRPNLNRLQYYSGGAWTNMLTIAASTEYFIEMVFNDTANAYAEVRVNGASYAAGAALGEPGGGIAGFRAEGTTGTNSQVYFDYVRMSAPAAMGYVIVDDTVAHSGTQSLRMVERGADDYCYFAAYMGGDNVKYGSMTFWFYPDDPLGGGQVYFYDSAQTNLVTIVDLGADIGAGVNPGHVDWVDGDGAGGGIIQGGPAFTTGAWYNITIFYNADNKSFEAFWNGASQGWFGFLDNAAPDCAIPVFFGDAPGQPQNFYYDDIYHWIDDPPAAPTGIWTEMPTVVNWNNYTTDQDNPVEGTVTGTEANTHGAGVETIQEVPSGGGTTTFINEDFSAGVPPAGWTQDGPSNQWASENANSAGGTAPQATFTWVNTVGVWHMYTMALDTTGMTSLDLQWNNYCDDYAAGVTCSIETSTDAATWHATSWSWTSGGGDLGPALETTTINNADVGSATFYLSFTVNGNAYQLDYWHIDDVLLTGTFTGGYSLEHRWRTQSIPAGVDTLTLYVNGSYNTGSDDNFDIGYSPVLGGPYTPVITINSDVPQLYSAVLPRNLAAGAPIYLNVVDTVDGEAGQDTVTIDEIRVQWENGTDVLVHWTLSADDGGGANDVAGYNVYYTDEEFGGGLGTMPTLLGTVPAGQTTFHHSNEALDTTWMCWYYVTAFDTYNTESSPSANASKFNRAPETQNLQVDGNPWPGMTISAGTLSVGLSCDIYDDTSWYEDIPKTDAAEWYDGFVGDPGEGAGTALTVSDGAWDSTSEYCTATIDTSTWLAGENHQIFVRGHETGPGNTGTGWSAGYPIWINVTAGPTAYDIDLTGFAAGDWAFVSFAYVMSGNVQDILNDATNGDGQTTWDTAKWWDATDSADPWKTYNPSKPAGLNDLVTVDETMGVWLHLTANGGDQVLTTGSTGSYSGSTLSIPLYTGWNLVGYPSATSRLASSTLPAQADLVAYYDNAAPYLITDAAPSAVTFSEGHAYWVHVTADTTWNVAP